MRMKLMLLDILFMSIVLLYTISHYYNDNKLLNIKLNFKFDFQIIYNNIAHRVYNTYT